MRDLALPMKLKQFFHVSSAFAGSDVSARS
jgi:hypothetical protein